MEYPRGTRLNKSEILEGTGYDPKRFRFIQHNTLEGTLEDGTRIIRHFTTDILTFKPDGTIIFSTGGTYAMTTRARLNEHQDLVSFWTERRVMYARANKRVEYGEGKSYMTHDPDAEVFVYEDGMSFHPKHGFKGVGRKPDKRMIRKLRKYSKDFAAKLPVEMPGGGDCWHCCMTNSEGVTMGDQAHDTSHLISHLFDKPQYFVPSLLMHALTEAQRGDYVKAAAFKGDHHEGYFASLLESYRDQMAKDIYDYLYKRIIQKRFPCERAETAHGTLH
jgi:hypothetical protein